MDGGDERRGVDGRAEGEGVLQEEEVADVREVGLARMEEALEDAEVDEGGGFERVRDDFRIARSCADGGSESVRGWSVSSRKDAATLRLCRDALPETRWGSRRDLLW